MVLRHDPEGVLAIGQASHAWICGQLARAWGNAQFGSVRPLDEVALGAEQHDVGMARWDLDPPRDPRTGLPQSFMAMGAEANARLWSRGPVRLLTQSRYAALLAIMHGRRLYERHDLAAAPPSEAVAVRAFLHRARELEGELSRSLRADPATAAWATPELIERNSRLVWIWDTISLALLLDWTPLTLERVPIAGGGTVDVALAPEAGCGRSAASLSPWPFAASAVRVRCEGRRLTGPAAGDEALRNALAAAPWETIAFDLRPGR